MDQPTQTQVTDTTVALPRTLRATATYLDRYGWIQGAYYDQTAVCFTPAACLVGALGMVCYGGPVDAPALNFTDPGFAEFEAALAYLDRFLTARYGGMSYEFNDAKDHTATDVILALGEAADQWDAEHKHDERPHLPGTLFDCPACESTCLCDAINERGVLCVACTLFAEEWADRLHAENECAGLGADPTQGGAE